MQQYYWGILCRGRCSSIGLGWVLVELLGTGHRVLPPPWPVSALKDLLFRLL